MQKCAPLPPNAEVRVGIAQDVEIEGPVEDGLVVVGRAVEQADALSLA